MAQAGFAAMSERTTSAPTSTPHYCAPAPFTAGPPRSGRRACGSVVVVPPQQLEHHLVKSRDGIVGGPEIRPRMSRWTSRSLCVETTLDLQADARLRTAAPGSRNLVDVDIGRPEPREAERIAGTHVNPVLVDGGVRKAVADLDERGDRRP